MAYLPTAVHAASKSIWEGEKMGGQLQADESTRNEKNGQNIYIDSCKRTSVQETKRMEKIESKDQWNRNQNKMAYLPAVLLLLLLPRSSRCTTTTAGLYLLGSQSSFYYAAIAACGLASIRRPCGSFLRFFCVIFFSFFLTSRCCLVIEGSIKVLSESIPVHYLLRQIHFEFINSGRTWGVSNVISAFTRGLGFGDVCACCFQFPAQF